MADLLLLRRCPSSFGDALPSQVYDRLDATQAADVEDISRASNHADDFVAVCFQRGHQGRADEPVTSRDRDFHRRSIALRMRAANSLGWLRWAPWPQPGMACSSPVDSCDAKVRVS